MTESNENCLDGMRCPGCGSLGPYMIRVTCMATVSDDGTDDFEGVEWEDDAPCTCNQCGHRAKVKDFKDHA